MYEVLGRNGGIAEDEVVKNHTEHFGSDLLVAVAPRAVRIAMALDDKSVKAHVERLLRERRYEFALTADMTRVTDDGNLRESYSQIQRYTPLGIVTIDLRTVSRESAVDNTETMDAGIVETFECADPQLQVRINRVLDKHRYVLATLAQHIGDLLHCKRIG